MVLKHHPDKRGDGGGYSRERLDAVFTCIKHGKVLLLLVVMAVAHARVCVCVCVRVCV